jgi:hypothetical protein
MKERIETMNAMVRMETESEPIEEFPPRLFALIA